MKKILYRPPYRRRLRARALVLALSWLAPGVVSTAEVYRWIDPNGVVHFGDKAPAGPGAAQVQPIPLPPPLPGAYDPRDEYFSIVNQARRMAEQRLEEEKAWRQRLEAEAALERERRAAEAERGAQVAPSPLEPYVITRPWVRPWPFPYTDFSEHPGGHPAFSPYWSTPPWGGSHHPRPGPALGPAASRSQLKPAP